MNVSTDFISIKISSLLTTELELTSNSAGICSFEKDGAWLKYFGIKRKKQLIKSIINLILT